MLGFSLGGTGGCALIVLFVFVEVLEILVYVL